ncbi:MAG: hypothetical protein QF858_00020 [Candidatus Pacebacteria bacterium]|nr:hypothetical protein [Candidatus Paceibacterota bacterium]
MFTAKEMFTAPRTESAEDKKSQRAQGKSKVLKKEDDVSNGFKRVRRPHWRAEKD